MGFFDSYYSYFLWYTSLRVQLMAAVVVTFVSVTGIMTTHSLPNHLLSIHSPLNHSLPISTAHQAFPSALAAPHLPSPTPHLLLPDSNSTFSSFPLLSDPASAHTLTLPVNSSLLLPPLQSFSLPALPSISHHLSSSQTDGASALWFSLPAWFTACPGVWSGAFSGALSSTAAHDLLKALSNPSPVISRLVSWLHSLLSLSLSAPRLLFEAATATTAAVSPGLVSVPTTLLPCFSPFRFETSQFICERATVFFSSLVSLFLPVSAVSGTAKRAPNSDALLPFSFPPFASPPCPSWLGLALAYALPIVSLLNGTLTSLADTEKDMVAVERVLEYLDLQHEPHAPPMSPLPAPQGRDGEGAWKDAHAGGGAGGALAGGGEGGAGGVQACEHGVPGGAASCALRRLLSHSWWLSGELPSGQAPLVKVHPWSNCAPGPTVVGILKVLKSA
ncbi:unnamed protein product [Closterium sp. Naga37s-1]|nr:unnamed protein product [Closterium sp. Naga37s-1]